MACAKDAFKSAAVSTETLAAKWSNKAPMPSVKTDDFSINISSTLPTQIMLTSAWRQVCNAHLAEIIQSLFVPTDFYLEK